MTTNVVCHSSIYPDVSYVRADRQMLFIRLETIRTLFVNRRSFDHWFGA